MNPKIIGLILVILALVVGLFAFGEIGGAIPSIGGEQKYDVTCNFDIANTLFNHATIDNLECNWQKSSVLFSITDIIFDEGNVRMEAQEISVASSYKVMEISRQKKTLTLKKLDDGETTITIRLFDSNLKQIDLKTSLLNIGG